MKWMFAHAHPLFFSELRRLAQNRIRHTDLADVMQQRTKLQRLHIFTAQTVFASESQTVSDHAFRVTMSFRVSGFECSSQRLECGAVGAFERIQGFIEFDGSLFD